MAEQRRRGSRLGRALSAVFGFGGEGPGTKASASVVSGQAAPAVTDGARNGAQGSEEAQPKGEETQRLNQSLVGYGLDVVVRVNERGEIVQTNDDMEQATGKNGRNLKGTDVFAWFNDPVRIRQLFERAVETGDTVRDGNMEIRHRDGFETPVSTTIMVQQDSNDRVLGGILLCRA